MSANAYNDILLGPLAQYVLYSESIGGDVATHSKMVQQAFQAQLDFLKNASRSVEPPQSQLLQLLSPTDKKIQEIQGFREKNRVSKLFNHLSAISESIPALGWVAVKPAPAPYVKEMNDAGQFYTNRVLKEWKETDKTHVNWVRAWAETLTQLQQYVKQYHTTGLVWAVTNSGPPPPPPPSGLPPPPPPLDLDSNFGDMNVNDDRAALFAQINQGEDITKKLKKVTSEMQTHKNPTLRTGPAPFKAPSSTGVTGVRNAPPAEKQPVFSRDGKKWLIEYHKGNQNLVVDNVEMNNVVYVFKCEQSNIRVNGKLNSVVLDSCKKTSIVFDSLVSSIEFINCQSVQMQVLGKVPTISVDKTDGCQMYLSKDSLDVEIISSKSSEMNILVPKDNGDYTEFPVPEQFKTTVSTKGLSTIIVENKG
ncbi:adenylyl cyclase-associated protein 1 isoform X2 [Chrysoperla carnea]|nr:adenylyl cyclase-associated protein 1 isoform X2 [Chrysoperla carnea]XP_044741408.1 adenylyl cyclase-associated protein 1 isoform X2 [Chrysoperla carnea]XP_044741409.1 adenylyl cyclase-associated protein 1 isoform X2 [Chrysoperla carnea]